MGKEKAVVKGQLHLQFESKKGGGGMDYQSYYRIFKNCSTCFVIIGIDIGFERKRNLSPLSEFLKKVLQLELRSSEAEKKHTLTLSSSSFILLKIIMGIIAVNDFFDEMKLLVLISCRLFFDLSKT